MTGTCSLSLWQGRELLNQSHFLSLTLRTSPILWAICLGLLCRAGRGKLLHFHLLWITEHLLIFLTGRKLFFLGFCFPPEQNYTHCTYRCHRWWDQYCCVGTLACVYMYMNNICCTYKTYLYFTYKTLIWFSLFTSCSNLVEQCLLLSICLYQNFQRETIWNATPSNAVIDRKPGNTKGF